jgi:hypothetical protein
MSWTIQEPNATDCVDYPVYLTPAGGTTGVICAVANNDSSSYKKKPYDVMPPYAYVFPYPPPSPVPPPANLPGVVRGVSGAGGSPDCFLFSDVPLADVDNNPNTLVIWDGNQGYAAQMLFYGAGVTDDTDCGGGGGVGLRAAMTSNSRRGCRGSDALTIPPAEWHLQVVLKKGQPPVHAVLCLNRLDVPWEPPAQGQQRLCVWQNQFKPAGGKVLPMELQCESPCPRIFTLKWSEPHHPVVTYNVAARNFNFRGPNTLWQKLNPDGTGQVKKAPPCITIYPA